MRPSGVGLSVVMLLPMLVLGTACDDVSAPEMGGIDVVVLGNAGLDSLSVVVGSELRRFPADVASFRFSPLGPGEHSVRLVLPDDCEVQEGNPQRVRVTAGRQTRVTFTLTCQGQVRIEVTTSTTGRDIDPDGYVVTIMDPHDWVRLLAPIAANGSVSFSDSYFKRGGTYVVILSGIAPNCSVSGPSSQMIVVEARKTGSVRFSLVCRAESGSIRVSAETFGEDLPADYAVFVDGETRARLGANGVVTVGELAFGRRLVQLGEVAENCLVAEGGTKQVTTDSISEPAVRFTVYCTLATPLRIVVRTTGSDLDPDGYAVRVLGAYGYYDTWATVPVNGAVEFKGLSTGWYSVTLAGVAPNCAVQGESTRAITFPSLTSVEYDVSCAPRAPDAGSTR